MAEQAPQQHDHDASRDVPLALVQPLPDTLEIEPALSPWLALPSLVGRGALWLAARFATVTHDLFVGHPEGEAHHPRSEVVQQLFVSGVRALLLVCVIGAGAGAAIVLQSMMAPAPPSSEFGRMLVVLVLRELAPLLTAIVMAGHSGTAMGSMLQPVLDEDDDGMVRSQIGERPTAAPRIIGSSIAGHNLRREL